MPHIKSGVVVSDKMQKTVVVEIHSKIRHPLYKKLITKTTRLKVHDDLGVKVGQKVKVQETKPMSKDVNFKVLEVIK